MEGSRLASTWGRMSPTVRQAVAGRPTTMGLEVSRHEAGASTCSELVEDVDFQSLHESSESGRRKLAAPEDMREGLLFDAC
jgi:DNA-binding transcriptional regulator YdaS (Cro superfamily)